MAAVLTVVDEQSAPPLNGEDVLREIGELLLEKLPRVPNDDPYRGALLALLTTSGARGRPTPVRGDA